MGAGAPERIVVVGPGAMGSLLAARLARGLPDAGVILAGGARSSPATAAHLAAAAGGGIAVSGSEEFTARPRIARGPEGGPADALLFAVKAGRVPAAAGEFAPLLGPHTRCAVLSNGLDVCEGLPAAYPPGRIARGLFHGGAERTGPGAVRAAGALGLLLAPAFEAPAEEGAENARAIAEPLRRAGIRVECAPSGREAEWRKAAANLLLNPLGALLRMRNGALLESAPAAGLMEVLAAEAQRVVDALGLSLSVGEIAAETARATAANRNSMWVDLEAGRETELEALPGRLLARAGRLGIEVPAHRAVYLCLKALEERNRKKGDST